jgi:hypothetical protein
VVIVVGVAIIVTARSRTPAGPDTVATIEVGEPLERPQERAATGIGPASPAATTPGTAPAGSPASPPAELAT